jgi:hypothetical protein
VYAGGSQLPEVCEEDTVILILTIVSVILCYSSVFLITSSIGPTDPVDRAIGIVMLVVGMGLAIYATYLGWPL